MSLSLDNRTRLLEAAERLFAEKGFAATSVREILRAAGVTSPTLYHYFGSKEELLVTLLRERVEDFFGQVREGLATATTPFEVFRRYASLALAGVGEQTTTVRFVFSVLFGPQAGVPATELQSVYEVCCGVLPDALARTAPQVTQRRAMFVAALFDGMVNGMLMLALKGYVSGADERLASAIAARAAAMLEDELPVPDLGLVTPLVPLEEVSP